MMKMIRVLSNYNQQFKEILQKLENKETKIKSIEDSLKKNSIKELNKIIEFLEKLENENTIDALKQRIEFLEKSKNENDNTRPTTTSAISSENLLGQTLDDELDGYASAITTLQTTLGSQETVITTLQTTLGTYDTDIATLQTIQETLDADITNLQTTQVTLGTDIATLQTTQETLDADITNLQTTQGSQETVITTLQNTLGTYDTDITTLQTTQETLDADITNLQTNQESQGADITTLQTTLGSHDADITALQTKHLQNESAINSNTANISNLTAGVNLSFSAWSNGEPDDRNSTDVLDRSGKDNWLPAFFRDTNVVPPVISTYDAEYPGFLYPGVGAPGQEDARAFNVFSGAFQNYYLPVSNIPYACSLQRIGWCWNGFNPYNSSYSAPLFDIDITVYLYRGFKDPGSGSNLAIPGINGDMDSVQKFTYRWTTSDATCDSYVIPVEDIIHTDNGQSTSVSVSIKGIAPNPLGTTPPSIEDISYVQWKGSFSIGLGFAID